MLFIAQVSHLLSTEWAVHSGSPQVEPGPWKHTVTSTLWRGSFWHPAFQTQPCGMCWIQTYHGVLHLWLQCGDLWRGQEGGLWQRARQSQPEDCAAHRGSQPRCNSDLQVSPSCLLWPTGSFKYYRQPTASSRWYTASTQGLQA